MDFQRSILFAGRYWSVKSSKQHKIGPGPNYFSNSQNSVWVDQKGLHLKIKKINGVWHSAQVVLDQHLGYGKYIVHLASRVDNIDKNVVLGIFTYDHTAPEVNYRQIDIQIAKWGDQHNKNGQFIVQTKKQDKISRFPVKLNGDYTTHVIDWKPERINFQMMHDHHQKTPQQSYYMIKQWKFNQFPVYKGRENFIINLWLLNNKVPSNQSEYEVIVKNFIFVPY